MNKKNTILFLLISIAAELFLRLDYRNASLILTELRIPRLILAFSIGSALSLSGAVMQTVLSNPLAEPYTLGIASGAALGAAIFNSLGFHYGFFGLNAGAVLGSILVLLLILRVIVRNEFRFDSMILLGVMLSMFCSSLLAIWMAIADPVGVQTVTFWLLGDLTRVGLKTALALLVVSIVALVYFHRISKKLDGFLFGDSMVEGFGVSLKQTQAVVVVVVSVLVGFCVSAAGMIGFVGLMVPHLVRKKMGTSIHGKVLPYAFTWGGIALVLSDAIAHTVSYPMELPVGAVTALIGAPVFIYLFIYRKFGRGVEA
jgi:iron complex transport system permease protein